MSVRRSVRKLSLMIPVCHACAARGGPSRCADGRVGIGEVVEREWSRAECVGGADGAAARRLLFTTWTQAGSGSSIMSFGKGVTGTGMRSIGGICGLTG